METAPSDSLSSSMGSAMCRAVCWVGLGWVTHLPSDLWLCVLCDVCSFFSWVGMDEVSFSADLCEPLVDCGLILCPRTFAVG
jgi:hypothetical protein